MKKSTKIVPEVSGSSIMSREEELATLRANGFDVKETPKGTFITKPKDFEFEYRIEN